jgi:hypothetical protein
VRAEAAAAAVGRLDDEHLAQRVSHAAYGSIVVLAVILALEGRTGDSWEVVASVVGAAVATAMAEIYADYLGATIRAHRRLTREERHAAARNISAGFVAAILPGIFFVLAAADVIAIGSAFDAAKWTGVGVLGGYAFLANRLAGLSIAHSVAVGAGFAFVGAALVVLKIAIG